MSFLTSTRVVRTALASAALLVLSSVAAPAAQAYNPDIDGDGIPNTWEMKGYDADGDGKIDVDYPGMGANPLKKDIFVEMDYMPGLLASEEELDRITESFAQLPVRNPNGTTGINIHLDAGNARSAKYNLGGGNEVVHEQLDNTMTKWAEIRAKNMDPYRESVFHYMIWGDSYGDRGSSGQGWVGGRGFIVTVGPRFWGKSATPDVRVATFVHELGHNLGMDHGGTDGVNYKPNYMSIMNYRYQLRGLDRADGTKYFGYSTRAYKDLDETKLDEKTGFGRNAYGLYYNGKPAWEAIDFNGNGKIDDEPVEADINGDGKKTVLTAPNDLKTLKLQAKGKEVQNGAYSSEAELSGEIEDNEMTAEYARAEGLVPAQD
ncbi:zinc-dependent metalloprotease family protein [uncultured Rothia sp.]|uniref:zinc-dependent metalloprotease family protein n=1 Tax=uncultured Rothia sp. TaxID=316088 RepID=UPI0025FB58C8|nr:zinc-dependent metalloprotease family protein [uncultured Rothia sp.]